MLKVCGRFRPTCHHGLMANVERQQHWDGFYNARDLGRVPTSFGEVPAGRAFRSASMRFVTEKGWQEAWDAGVRTIIDLRNFGEAVPEVRKPGPGDGGSRPDGGTSDAASAPDEVSARPEKFDYRQVPIDDIENRELWEGVIADGLGGSPLYYPRFFEHAAEAIAPAIASFANAAPGGVLFHCAVGRDRTGAIAGILLSLAGATPEAIADDYAMSAEGLAPLFERIGLPDQAASIDERMRAHGTTVHGAMVDAFRDFDARAFLKRGGLDDETIDRAAARMGASARS